MSSRRQTFAPNGVVKTATKGASRQPVETEAGDATIDDLVNQMSHRQQ